MHQHEMLATIKKKIEDAAQRRKEQSPSSRPANRGDDPVQEFFDYKAHVNNEMHQVIGDDGDPVWSTGQADVENEWPEYKPWASLLCRPCEDWSPSTIGWANGHLWKKNYWKTVQRNQQLLQHHVHPVSNEKDENGKEVRKPLPYCQCKSKPGQCKHGFPHTMETEFSKASGHRCHVICPGVAKEMGVTTSGRRSTLGMVGGPRNDEWVNGTHPALLFDLGCNSDTLLTYRLPIMAETHSAHCPLGEACLSQTSMDDLIIAAQRAQRDQAGYMSDYVVRCLGRVRRFSCKVCTGIMSAIMNATEDVSYGGSPLRVPCMGLMRA